MKDRNELCRESVYVKVRGISETKVLIFVYTPNNK